MNKLFAPFLPPWAETGLQPAFYDLESGTVIQQTARMYDKVNQLIRLFNELSEETQTTVEEYIAKFIELKDFVDDYFDNLDVQEEINNKLDDMTEDGTLQEIIASYLDSNVSWTFDSVAEMQSATNLTSDSYATTLGYYSVGDNGGATYKILATNDTPDGGSVINLSGGLQAHLVAKNNNITPEQFGAKGDDTNNDSVAINNAMKFGEGRIITFSPNKTYLVTGNQFMQSNTIINLNGATLHTTNWYPELSSVCSAGYTGITNFTVKNGTITGNVHFNFYHSTNITFEDILFDNAHTSNHLFDLAGVKNIKIKNCEVYGNNGADWSSQYASIETIQTEFAGEGSIPNLDVLQPDIVHDNIPSIDVLIEGCYFHKKPTDTDYSDYIGTHFNYSGSIVSNVTIRDCKFEGWYSNAIRYHKIKNLTIDNCTFIAKESTYTGDKYSSGAIFITPSTNTYSVRSENIKITNNRLISPSHDDGHFFAWLVDDESGYSMNNIEVANNICNCEDFNNFISISNANNVSVHDNIIERCEFFFNKKDGATITNLNVYNNTANIVSFYGYGGFIRSSSADTVAGSTVDNLFDSNNIITYYVSSGVTNTINTSQFLDRVTLSDNQSLSTATNTRIAFDTQSSPLTILTGDATNNEMRIIRDARRVKISGRIIAKVTTGSYINFLEVYVWDNAKAEKATSAYAMITNFTNQDWSNIELPILYLDNKILKSQSGNIGRYSLFIRMNVSGSAEIKSDGTYLDIASW